MDRSSRQLQRRAVGGDVNAEARLLRERLRLGQLGTQGLGLAAYCGYAPARVALGTTSAPSAKWPDGLARWGKEACVRTLIAIARPALNSFDSHEAPDPDARNAFEAGLAWVRCPCAEHAERAGLSEFTTPMNIQSLREAQAKVLSRVARIAAYPVTAAHWSLSAAAALLGLDDRRLPDHVLDELVPWALSRYDPLHREG